MITEKIKAKALSRLKRGEEVNIIAEELNLPSKLVSEWRDGLELTDLTVIEANVQAVETIYKNEDTLDPLLSEKLRVSIEETSIDVTKAIPLVVLSGDPMQAKAIECICNGLANLYKTIVLKGGVIEHDPSDKPSKEGLGVFKGMLGD